jgi:hypothetical protein
MRKTWETEGAPPGTGWAASGLNLGDHGAVGVIGDQQGSLLSGGDLGCLGGRRVPAGEQALVGALKLTPESHTHDG